MTRAVLRAAAFTLAALSFAPVSSLMGQGNPAQDTAAAAAPPADPQAQLPRPLTPDTAAAAPTLAASAGVAPDTVTVGDHFRVLLRVQAPAGATVAFPDFSLVEPVEAIDSVRVRRDSLGAWIATYRLVAWTTSDSLVAAMPIRVRSPDAAVQDLRVRVKLPFVRSVLPADTSLHVPKPAKAVIPIVVTGPTPRGWLVPAILLATVLAGIVWLVIRRRTPLTAGPVDARAAALKRLAEIEQERLLERGEVHAYHVRTSRVLREYLLAVAGLGEDLTTTEVLWSMPRDGSGPAVVDELERLLREADRVKFSGAARGAAFTGGGTHGEAAGRWIVAWPAAGGAGPGRRSEAA
jgi:hypothetical protein